MDKSALDYTAHASADGMTGLPAPGTGSGETAAAVHATGQGPLPTAAALAAAPPAQQGPVYGETYSGHVDWAPAQTTLPPQPLPPQTALPQTALPQTTLPPQPPQPPLLQPPQLQTPQPAASVAPVVGGAPQQAAGLEDLARQGVPIAREGGDAQLPRLPDKGLAQARTRSRSALTLGVLQAHHALCEEWDYVHPLNAPYVDSKEGGKLYETLNSFFDREKGRAPVMTVSKGAADMGAAVLDSLYRVVLAAAEGRFQYREDPLHELLQWCLKFGGEGAATGGCRRADCALVAQLAALYRRTAPHQSRYGGLDIEVLDTIMKNDPSGRASQAFDRWGMLLAQAYVDFLRFLGQQAMSLHWEKKTTLSPELLAGLVRMLPMVTGVQLPYDAVTALWEALD